MPAGALSGAAPLRLLVLLRMRGRVRAFRAGLRRPARVLMLLFAVALVAFLAWNSPRTGRHARDWSQAAVLLPCLLLAFTVLSTWAAARHGVIAFTPEEVHFLFPAPVTSRALLLTHLLTSAGKSFTGGFFFALFLRPPLVSLPWAALGYGGFLFFLALLQVRIDISCMRLQAPARARRARFILAFMLALVAGSSALALQRLGPDADLRVLRYAIWPLLPFVSIICGRAGPPEIMQELLGASLPLDVSILLVLGTVTLLAAGVLSFQGDVREAAHHTSVKLQARIERIRRGRALMDAPKALSGGRVLPMLPRLGGAGVHAWRQLTVLSRSRKPYLLLVVMTLLMGVSMGLAQRGSAQPSALSAAASMLAMLVFVGPMYVQCDFRADYECLPWLRSLPTPPGILAAGQLLASALVLYVLQVLLTGWVFFVLPASNLPWLAVMLVCLPVFNLLQLSVWNGFHLLYPMRMTAKEGSPPGAVQVVRLYLVVIGVFVVLGLATAIAAAFGVLAWFGAGWLGASATLVRLLAAGIAGFTALCLVTAVCIWCVGRIFVRIDPSRDLND